MVGEFGGEEEEGVCAQGFPGLRVSLCYTLTSHKPHDKKKTHAACTTPSGERVKTLVGVGGGVGTGQNKGGEWVGKRSTLSIAPKVYLDHTSSFECLTFFSPHLFFL